MNRIKFKILFLLIVPLFIFCNKEIKPRKVVNIEFKEFKIDSSSIRAIEILNDTTVLFAGSKGDVGAITDSKITKLSNNLITDGITPHFRALSYTKNSVYALSIGNPALLYQFKKKTPKIVYKEIHENVFYDSMKFFDDLNGIAIGDPIDNCLSVLITKDGGNSWKKIPCENLPQIEKGEAAFAASNTNIAIIGRNAWIVTGGKKARVLHTANMGISWKMYETPVIQGKETTGIYTVDFYNENIGIICGGDYTNKFGNSANKAITKDGGKTWKLVAENEAPKYVSCVQYVPNSDGKEIFAVSTNGIFFSNNGGEKWIKVHEKGFFSIRIVDENNAWLSGNEIIAKMKIN